MMDRATSWRLHWRELDLPGVMHVQRRRIGDARGHFSRVFCAEELEPGGWTWPVRQVNHAYTKRRGTVRGMHYQLQPKAEAKLVSCIRGSVWDVAVDLREGSPTRLHWVACELHAEQGHALIIPPGFAHGFQALTDDVELLYAHSELYDAELERGLNPEDPALAIPWPLKPDNLSERDRSQRFINPSDFVGVLLT